jgi:hypothetical protein
MHIDLSSARGVLEVVAADENLIKPRSVSPQTEANAMGIVPTRTIPADVAGKQIRRQHLHTDWTCPHSLPLPQIGKTSLRTERLALHRDLHTPASWCDTTVRWGAAP